MKETWQLINAKTEPPQTTDYVSASGVLAPKNSYCHSTSTSSVELRAFIVGCFPMTDRRRTWSAKNLLAGLKNLYPCLFICLSSVAIIIP